MRLIYPATSLLDVTERSTSTILSLALGAAVAAPGAVASGAVSTVPAGKRWLIQHVGLQLQYAGAPVAGDDGEGAIVRDPGGTRTPIFGDGINGVLATAVKRRGISSGLVLNEGETIGSIADAVATATVGANLTVQGFLYGWEFDII